MDEPDWDDGVSGHVGCTMVQLFSGIDLEHMTKYTMATKCDYHHTLAVFICDHGAMHSLHSNNAKEDLSALVQDIFKMYLIWDSESEANDQPQNLIMSGALVTGGGCVCYLLLTFLISLLI